jgi:hypothetical protein
MKFTARLDWNSSRPEQSQLQIDAAEIKGPEQIERLIQIIEKLGEALWPPTPKTEETSDGA